MYRDNGNRFKVARVYEYILTIKSNGMWNKEAGRKEKEFNAEDPGQTVAG